MKLPLCFVIIEPLTTKVIRGAEKGSSQFFPDEEGTPSLPCKTWNIVIQNKHP